MISFFFILFKYLSLAVKLSLNKDDDLNKSEAQNQNNS